VSAFRRIQLTAAREIPSDFNIVPRGEEHRVLREGEHLRAPQEPVGPCGGRQGGSQGGRPQCMDIVEDAEGGTFTEDRRERFPPFRLLPWGRLHRRLVACGGHDDRTCQERFPGAGLRRLDDSKGDRAWDGRTEDGRQ